MGVHHCVDRPKILEILRVGSTSLDSIRRAGFFLKTMIAKRNGEEPDSGSLRSKPDGRFDLDRFRQENRQTIHRSAFTDGGQDWIRTSEGVSQRIYSPPRLATSVPTHLVCDSQPFDGLRNAGTCCYYYIPGSANENFRF